MRAWVPLLLLAAGCDYEPPPATFIALERDLAAYREWESVTFDGTVIPEHKDATRTVFLNARPEPGLSSWPVGTMLVKQMPSATLAMAKRGGEYNAKGAAGWEWFELVLDSAGTPRIKWRGLGPPAGEEYGGSTATCNDCHGPHTANDCVLSAGFQLLHH